VTSGQTGGAPKTQGQRVAWLRERLGLLPAELARRVGISQPSLWAIENDVTKDLKSSTLMRLCDELVTTKEFIVFGVSGEGGIELATMEAELIHAIRALSGDRRIALVEYARFLMSQQEPRRQQPPAGGSQQPPSVVRPLRPRNS
jgi:transcriptional regulator with XRE-family HTH domain